MVYLRGDGVFEGRWFICGEMVRDGGEMVYLRGDGVFEGRWCI